MPNVMQMNVMRRNNDSKGADAGNKKYLLRLFVWPVFKHHYGVLLLGRSNE